MNTKFEKGKSRTVPVGRKVSTATWLARLGLIMIIMGWLASPVSAQTVRYYAVTTTPTSVAAGTDNLHAFTIENCNGSAACEGAVTSSNQTIKSIRVTIPAGFSVDTSSCSVSAAAGDIWNLAFPAGEITIVKQSNTDLNIGESLTLSCVATAPCEAGFYEWTTYTYNGSDFTTPYTLKGAQPEVEVTGTCGDGGFLPGDYCTISQGGWGSPPNGGNPGAILAANFDAVYTDLVVGTGFAMTFESAPNVEAYLPAGGTPNPLAGSVTNPTSTSAGVFGGQATALKLNVDFNDAGIIDGAEGSISGLTLQGTGTSLDEMTVAQILAAVETALGGGALPAGYSYSMLNDLADELNNAFHDFEDIDCYPSDWAIEHLTP